MCAISGIWKLNGRPVTRDAIVRFTDSMSHRGPDGAGYWIEGGEKVALGHRRLAILDCSSLGAQPMEGPAGRKIVFNGEIYNFIELREELRALGYAFRSESDTEVILHAFDAWGPACLERFNGMWAFAIWDPLEKRLFMARDRFGVKPLHILHRESEIFAIASETSAFRHLEGFRREIDPGRLATGIENVFRLEGAGETLFRDIRQLLPGHHATFDGREFRQTRWWNTVDHLAPRQESYEQSVERFRELFESACRLRLRSDVPVGSALSGGLDSSAVVGMIRSIRAAHDAERLPQSCQTAFIHSMPGSDIDETAYATEVAKYVGSDTVVLELELRDLPARLRTEAQKLDFIYLTPSIMADLYRQMRQSGVVVSLDGHGVDEMLYGYPDLVELAWQDATARGDRPSADDLRRVLLDMIPVERRGAMDVRLRRFGKPEPVWKKWLSGWRGGRKMPESWLRAKPAEIASPNWTSVPKTFSNSERALYMNFHEWVLPTLLRNYDRVSMQSGVEIRMPFMDWRIATLAFSLPESAKLGMGFTKRILRDGIAGLIPESVRRRTLKIGWNAPMHEWFANELREWVVDEVSSQSFLESPVWNGPAIRDFVLERARKRKWTFADCSRVWPYLNAQILLS